MNYCLELANIRKKNILNHCLELANCNNIRDLLQNQRLPSTCQHQEKSTSMNNCLALTGLTFAVHMQTYGENLNEQLPCQCKHQDRLTTE